jgi:hypothetical protein
MNKVISLLCSIILILGLTACSGDKSKDQAATPQPAGQQAAPELAGAPATPVTGKVLETMDAAGYTYLNVETAEGAKWIAVNQADIKVGDEVTYLDGMVMQNFFSKSLDRTFPEIVFSSGLVGAGSSIPGLPAAGSGAESFSQALTSESGSALDTAVGMATGSVKAVVPLGEIKVEKASGENSFTVAEIYTKAEELNGKTVIVRGKVVKVSPGIMGRNWIHIQDGTGSPDDPTHDLVVTTSQDPEADWDIITVEGILAANKDFGSGYSYRVIIEEASINQ